MNNEKGFIQVIALFLILIVIGVFVYPALRNVAGDIFSTFPLMSPSSSTPRKSPPPKSSPIKTEVVPPVKEELPEVKEEPDLDSPKRSNPQPRYDLDPGTLKYTISLETDEIATCKYSQVSGLGYDGIQKTFENTQNTFHSSFITTLLPGNDYIFYVRCNDEEGNKNIDDFEISFFVPLPEDTTPPERRHPYPTGELPAGTKGVTMTITTNEAARCSYSDTPEGSYSSFSSNEYNTYHQKNITGLSDGTTYDYFVNCCDFSNNCNIGNLLIRFNIASE
ncbi:MAG TPA: hypothetical protein QGH92_01145 [Candidatus Parcubacteria bacterium]|nr:hypothetical protein [Candidatus Parcubacteria bacterium]|tara:strand:+ start:268 stop:1101 length:834 start_codon:yes stop_codon:yes gene_type:complete